jgi:signal transduction histidine kinase
MELMQAPRAAASADRAPAAALPALAGGCVAAVGALVLAGWVLDIGFLKSVYGPITMKTNTAIGLLVCGLSLWAAASGRSRVAVACASVATTIGLLTLVQHLSGWNFGIDELLFTEAPGAAATASPNRMGPNGATSLVLTGAALLLLLRGTPRSARLAQWTAVGCSMLAMLAVAGYVYGAVQLYAVAQITGIALHTALSFLVLSVGILAVRVDDGPVATLLADGPAGTLLRRLVGPVVLVPLILGYVLIKGRNADLYDGGLTIALFAVSIVVVLGALLWQTATAIAASDARRRSAEKDRDELLMRERHARDEAERASKVKDDFIATLSHELRTPLNVMLGWTNILEVPGTEQQHARAAAIVARNGRLLARLVEDLLDISRAAAGHFEIAAAFTDFNAVVQASLDALGPRSAEKGVQLRGELDPSVGVIQADAERLQQIVWNLLSNSVKFTDTGGRVDVRTSRADGVVTLTVVDTGVGFAPEFAAELFQPFRQADPSTTRKHGGLGLGLSIARHIAELHGGSINGHSAGPGEGATFTLTIPAAGTGDTSPAMPAPSARIAGVATPAARYVISS